MEAFLISTGLIALAEIGDKTQLLAFILATRFKKPIPIIAGIFCATILNHSLAGAVGAWIIASVNAETLRWILAISFLSMAIWTLIPDKLDEETKTITNKLGVFGATLITFFLAEMGDKTQLATVAMVAHYANPIAVIIGTTIGMLIADVPAVFMGDKLAAKMPVKAIHIVVALIFTVLAIATIFGLGEKIGL